MIAMPTIPTVMHTDMPGRHPLKQQVEGFEVYAKNADKQAKAMIRLTHYIAILTWIMVVLVLIQIWLIVFPP